MVFNSVVPGINDLLTVNPALAAQWDHKRNGTLTPGMVAANTNKKVWWHCENGHSWQAVVASRNAGRGCPYCTNRRVLSGFNDLLTKNPTLAAEWDYEKNDGMSPSRTAPTSRACIWWKGPCGHSWKARVSNRHNGAGCPYCSGRAVLKGFNDLLTAEPQLCREWDHEKNGGLGPDQVSWGSSRAVWWKCSRGHSWKVCIPDRRRGNGCPYCANRRPVSGETDLQTIYPSLAIEWDHEKNGGLRPSEVTYSSRKKVWWKCSLGHSWNAEIYARHRGGGCPVCARKMDRHPVAAGQNDLKTINPELAAEWDYERNVGLTPDQVLPHSTRKVWWKCQNGHRFRSKIQTRIKGTRCPYCMGKYPVRSRIVR